MRKIASPHCDNIEKTRFLHRHMQLMRTFLLQGDRPGRIWEGLAKEPTFAQLRVLLALQLHEPCHLKSLAQAIGISRPAASEMVERLVEMNLVTRVQDPDDRRQILISLTDESRRRVERHEANCMAKLQVLLEHLGAEASDQWYDLALRMRPILEDITTSG